jgi:glutathione peroxidase
MRNLFSRLWPAVLSVGCFNRVQVGPVSVPLDQPQPIPAVSFFDLSATDINGQMVKLDQYKGKKVMVVSTASELYTTYKDKGFVILGFPSNDFGGQEPGTEAEIATFCQKNYGVTFPLMSKVSTKGAEQHAVYHWLANKSQNAVMDTQVKWNFHKYLIDVNGRLVMSLESGIEPNDPRITNWIEGK